MENKLLNLIGIKYVKNVQTDHLIPWISINQFNTKVKHSGFGNSELYRLVVARHETNAMIAIRKQVTVVTTTTTNTNQTNVNVNANATQTQQNTVRIGIGKRTMLTTQETSNCNSNPMSNIINPKQSDIFIPGKATKTPHLDLIELEHVKSTSVLRDPLYNDHDSQSLQLTVTNMHFKHYKYYKY